MGQQGHVQAVDSAGQAVVHAVAAFSPVGFQLITVAYREEPAYVSTSSLHPGQPVTYWHKHLCRDTP